MPVPLLCGGIVEFYPKILHTPLSLQCLIHTVLSESIHIPHFVLQSEFENVLHFDFLSLAYTQCPIM